MRWLNEYSRDFLNKWYLLEWQTTEERVRQIADKAEQYLGITGFSDKFYDYMSRGWFSLSSPVWANYGLERALSISCFNSHVEDDMGQIISTLAEVGMMTKMGWGTSGYFGDLRPRGATIKDNGTSSGPVHFMQLFESMMDVVSQGWVRRGSFAAYMPLSHPDIMEFLQIGMEGNAIQKMTTGVTVTDEWLQSMIDGDAEKRKIWATVLNMRTQIGYPYIFFHDTVNKNTVKPYKDNDLEIKSSNLCSEVLSPSNENWSFVCCLASMNLLHYDEWKNTDAIEVLTFFLDTVMEDFIQDLEKYKNSMDKNKRNIFKHMEKAYNFSVTNRSLGIGVLGYHSLLQSKMLPFESQSAAKLNYEIFKDLKEKTYAASEKLFKIFGASQFMKPYWRRNSTLLALAPTKSSSFILGQVSQGIEPLLSNYAVYDLAKIKVTLKNPFLEKMLEEKWLNTDEIWDSIKMHNGSVQHLTDILTEQERDVFKTFQEINQLSIIDQAGIRQQFIDQSQSLNLCINPKTLTAKDINQLYLHAWKAGVKTLYYQHSVNAAQEFARMKQCKSCEA